MLVVVLGEDVEVVGVERDVEVVVVAGLDLMIFSSRTAEHYFIKGEMVLCRHALAGKVSIGGLVLVVDVVGAADGVLIRSGYYLRVNVAVGYELTRGGEDFVHEGAGAIVETDACHADVAHFVVFLADFEGEAEECLGVMQGELQVVGVEIVFGSFACEFIAAIYGCSGSEGEVVTNDIFVLVYDVRGVTPEGAVRAAEGAALAEGEVSAVAAADIDGRRVVFVFDDDIASTIGEEVRGSTRSPVGTHTAMPDLAKAEMDVAGFAIIDIFGTTDKGEEDDQEDMKSCLHRGIVLWYFSSF